MHVIVSLIMCEFKFKVFMLCRPSLLCFSDSFRSCFRMKVGSVFGKAAGKEGTMLLLIYVLSGVCISTSQSLSVSGKRDAIFESMQYMYNCETLFSLR